MKNNFKKAFTLVELIVVITILAILATVAFISFQGYSAESRDAKRKTDLATISKGLQVYQALNDEVPEPSETKTTITYSGAVIITQGYAGDSVLNILKVQDVMDPTDEIFYTYSTDAQNTKFQLVGFLENNQTVNNSLQNNIFADYTDRYYYSVGQSVGVLLDNTNTPIQEVSSGPLELENNSTVYKTILNKQNIITESGSILKTEVLGGQKNLYGWRAFDVNCKNDDIKIGDQVWAGCNSTLGDGFEWGEDGSVQNCSITEAGNTTDCPAESAIMASNVNASESFTKTNEYGDKEVDNIYGKFYGITEFSSACPAGWKVPTHGDFISLENQLGCTDSENTGFRCDGLGWNNNISKNTSNNLVKALNLPLSGWRNITGSYALRGSIGLYATQSSQELNKITVRSFLYNNSSINNTNSSDAGKFSVRCIRQ